jgi:hypothetical protein
MTVHKSVLTAEQEAEVKKEIAAGKQKYGVFDGIIWESECPPEKLAEFEKELEE